MIEQVAAAFEGQAYSEVAHSLKVLAAEDPWNQLYQGRLPEVSGELAVEAIYRQLLRTATGSKVTTQAYQDLKCLISQTSTTPQTILQGKRSANA